MIDILFRNQASIIFSLSIDNVCETLSSSFLEEFMSFEASVRYSELGQNFYD